MTFVLFMNAPISFQTLLTSVRRGIHWKFVICYIDVIRISQTPSIKSYFAMIELKCLMHLITCKGVECYSSKKLIISKYSTPSHPKQARCFLGMENYFRKYVKGFSNIASPFNVFLAKIIKFNWTPECQQFLKALK